MFYSGGSQTTRPAGQIQLISSNKSISTFAILVFIVNNIKKLCTVQIFYSAMVQNYLL